jgi:uncharacterized protein
MIKHMRWRSKEYGSLEECRLLTKEDAIEVDSVINGSYDHNNFSVRYTIITNLNWETIHFSVSSEVNGKQRTISCSSDGKGNWSENGKTLPGFAGCTDIDIPLTPFTNTLPINRLGLELNAAAKIKVLYIDVLQQKETALHQRYTRIAAGKYKYENVPNDFEAMISVDGDGFVTDYPGLFSRAE